MFIKKSSRIITSSFLAAVIIFVLGLHSTAFCQTVETGAIHGFIYDESNGEALIGANIFIKELKMGASANLSGYFVLINVPTGTHEITVSLIGYKTKTQKVKINGGKETIKIKLEPEAVQSKEVVVTARPTKTIERLFDRPVSKLEITPQQINSIPQMIEADLLRSLQTIPGIVTLSDFSSALYIRGGTPDQNLFLIDGTDVYNPEHAFGIFSTFNTDAIKQVDLSKGGFGAEYGGRLSSVLNVTNLDGNRNRFEGTASVSLLSAKTTLQLPIGSIGSISGSFRRTYLDQTVGKMIDDIPSYYFYDGNLKAYFDLSDKDKLTISTFGGNDCLDYKFNQSSPDSPEMGYEWGNTTGSINYKRIISPQLFSNFWITGSRFSSDFKLDGFDIKEINSIDDITFKGDLDYFYSDKINFKFGFEQKNLHGIYKQEFPGGLIDINKRYTQYSAYTSVNYKPSVLWDLTFGLRGDYFGSERNFMNLDPRFSVKYRLTETVNLKFASGIYHQYLEKIPRGFFVGVWTAADKYTNASTALHYIFGIQKEVAQDYELEIESYYKDYKDIYTLNQYMNLAVTPDEYDNNNKAIYKQVRGIFTRGDGKSYGLELLFKKDAGYITGWIGYSLSRTENTFDDINQDKEFVPRHDRTSTINIVTNIGANDLICALKGINKENFSSNWTLGINFIYSTGQPITVPGSAYVLNTLPGWEENSFKIQPSEINNYRLPPYARLDISINWEKKYEGWSLCPYLQIINVGNRKNVWFLNYKDQTAGNMVTKTVDAYHMLPILPSFGVNIKF
jgi:hypothetical protein